MYCLFDKKRRERCLYACAGIKGMLATVRENPCCIEEYILHAIWLSISFNSISLIKLIIEIRCIV